MKKMEAAAQKILAALAVLIIFIPCVADTIDDAEAKKQGVPVETVQVQALRKQLAEANQEIADLKKQVENLQAQLAYAAGTIEKTKASMGPSPDFKEAIKAHRLSDGMSLEDAKAAFPSSKYFTLNWVLSTDATDGQSYRCTCTENFPTSRRDGKPGVTVIELGEMAHAHFTNGRIDYAVVEAEAVSNWQGESKRLGE